MAPSKKGRGFSDLQPILRDKRKLLPEPFELKIAKKRCCFIQKILLDLADI